MTTSVLESSAPVNQDAVIQTVLRASHAAYDSSEWLDFADAVKGNHEAKKLLEEVLWAAGTGKKDDARKALGIGMVAGMLYAELIDRHRRSAEEYATLPS